MGGSLVAYWKGAQPKFDSGTMAEPEVTRRRRLYALYVLLIGIVSGVGTAMDVYGWISPIISSLL